MNRGARILLICLIGALACALDAYSERRVALLGDSMTWIGGDSCQNERGWTHYLKEACDTLSLDLYARSGATWTNTSATRGNVEAYSEVLDDENVIYSQVLRLCRTAGLRPENVPDIILIYAGANDAWFASKRPGIFDESDAFPGSVSGLAPSDCLSLASSINLSCGILKEAFPRARIVLMTPVEMTRTSVGRIARVGDIIEDTGKKLGLTVLRGDRGVGIRRDAELKERRHTTDGVHTTPSGARLIADFVLKGLFD